MSPRSFLNPSDGRHEPPKLRAKLSTESIWEVGSGQRQLLGLSQPIWVRETLAVATSQSVHLLDS